MPNPYEPARHSEGANSYRPLIKVGLETPMIGRIWGENKRITFAPPQWYLLLVVACFTLGMLYGLAMLFSLRWVPLGYVAIWLSPSLILAGVWAVLSMEYAAFDLRSRTYFRREASGIFKRTRRGSMVDVDAVVLYCENYSLGGGTVVFYRIVIHWKNSVVPLLITERERASLPTGASLNHGAGRIAQRAHRYATLMGLPFYDNSHIHRSAPQSVV